jgi:THO complex subunit 7
MVAIRAEHDTQNRMIQGQKSALDTIISDLGSLRVLGKEREVASLLESPSTTPAPEGIDVAGDSAEDSGNIIGVGVVGITEEKEDKNSELSQSLNAVAKPFYPTSKLSAGLALSPSSKQDDIEMGEVEEDPKDTPSKSKKKVREELEEGEASDSSSALSDPPDD